MSNKMVMNIRYEFDITDNIEEYLREVLDVEPENATPEQHTEAREVVLDELNDTGNAHDFMHYVVTNKRPVRNGTTNEWNEFTYTLEMI